MTNLYHGGSALHFPSDGLGIAPNISTSVIKLLCHTSPVFLQFRMNGSHLFHCTTDPKNIPYWLKISALKSFSAAAMISPAHWSRLLKSVRLPRLCSDSLRVPIGRNSCVDRSSIACYVSAPTLISISSRIGLRSKMDKSNNKTPCDEEEKGLF